MRRPVITDMIESEEVVLVDPTARAMGTAILLPHLNAESPRIRTGKESPSIEVFTAKLDGIRGEFRPAAENAQAVFLSGGLPLSISEILLRLTLSTSEASRLSATNIAATTDIFQLATHSPLSDLPCPSLSLAFVRTKLRWTSHFLSFKSNDAASAAEHVETLAHRIRAGELTHSVATYNMN